MILSTLLKVLGLIAVFSSCQAASASDGIKARLKLFVFNCDWTPDPESDYTYTDIGVVEYRFYNDGEETVDVAVVAVNGGTHLISWATLEPGDREDLGGSLPPGPGTVYAVVIDPSVRILESETFGSDYTDIAYVDISCGRIKLDANHDIVSFDTPIVQAWFESFIFIPETPTDFRLDINEDEYFGFKMAAGSKFKMTSPFNIVPSKKLDNRYYWSAGMTTEVSETETVLADCEAYPIENTIASSSRGSNIFANVHVLCYAAKSMILNLWQVGSLL